MHDKAAVDWSVDESLSVLDAARDYGIGWLRAVRHTGDYPAVDRVADLIQ